MKRIKDLSKKLLLVSALAFSQLSAADTKTTNHTFFAARPQGINMAMEMPTWFGHVSRKDTTFGGSLQATGFFQHSVNGKDLAKYFMFDDKDSLRVHGADAATAHADAQVHPFNFNLATDAAGHDSTITLKPEQEVYGTRLDYHQELDQLFNGLYLSVSAPVVRVTNKPNLKENVTVESTHNGPKTVAQTLRGDRLTTDWSEPFRYGKIAGSQSVTGLADIDARLGFNFLQKRRVRAGLELGVTVPTGNKVTGEYLFEPLAGNGGHWGLGAGLNTLLALWEDQKQRDHNVCLSVHANYRYLFKDTERRTLELKGKKWARYIRMRQVDPTNDTRVLANSIPGVNALTRNLNITPGSQVEGLANLSYHRNRWTFNAGYNVWWKDKEQVSLRGKWEDAGRFGLASSTNGFHAGGTFTGHRNPNVDLAIARTALEVFKMAFDDGAIGNTNAAHGNYDAAATFLAPKLGFTQTGIADGGGVVGTSVLAQASAAVAYANAGTLNAATNAILALEATAGTNTTGIANVAAVAQLGGVGGFLTAAAPAANIGSQVAGIAHAANVTDPTDAADGIRARIFTPARALATQNRLPNTDLAAADHGIDLAINNRLPQLLLPMAKAQAIDSRTTIHTYEAGNDTEIAATDVDYDAVAHPSALTHKVFATVSYDFDCDHPTYLGLGGSYEFGDSRKALDQWAVWAKFGVSF